MFLKSGKRLLKPLPIWSKLTLLHLLSGAVVFSLAILFLYFALAHNFERESSLILQDQLQLVRKVLMNHPRDVGELKEEVKGEGGAKSLLKYYIRVLNDTGNTLVETPEMILSPDLFIVPTGENEKIERKIIFEDHPYWTLSAFAYLGGETREKRYVQLALDISHQETILREFRIKIAVVLFIAVMLSGILGVVVTRGGLKPLREIADSASRITANRLSERLHGKGWPEELDHLASSFDQMLGRLETSFDLLSQFSADLAHELRTPINNLMGSNQVILSKDRPKEEYKQTLESNLEELEKLSKIIETLLFLAKADNAQIAIKKIKFEADKESESIKEFYELLASEKGLKIKCQGKVSVNADPILYKRAVSNLLSNAIRYGHQGGSVTVDHESRADGSVAVIIRDDGSGIAPEDLPHIFDRFYRADKSRSHDSESSGLGLAIVKSIMTLHSGSVAAISQNGQGTVVTLLFPSA